MSIKSNTAKDQVFGMCRAMGPCTFGNLVAEILDQVIGVDTVYDAKALTVEAINNLMREGKIELYDTGDAWDAVVEAY